MFIYYGLCRHNLNKVICEDKLIVVCFARFFSLIDNRFDVVLFKTTQATEGEMNGPNKLTNGDDKVGSLFQM